MKKIIVSILLLSLSLFSADSADSVEKEKEQQFELTTLTGKKLHITTKPNGLDIKEIQGKVVFLSFFGYNCPPCKREIPEFIKMKKKYGKDLEIIAVEVRGLGDAYLKRFIKSKNINYTVIPFHKEAEKFAYHTAQKADWKGAIPFIIVLDRRGEVQFLQTGLIPYEALEMAFNKSKVEKINIKEKRDDKENNRTD